MVFNSLLIALEVVMTTKRVEMRGERSSQFCWVSKSALHGLTTCLVPSVLGRFLFTSLLWQYDLRIKALNKCNTYVINGIRQLPNRSLNIWIYWIRLPLRFKTSPFLYVHTSSLCVDYNYLDKCDLMWAVNHILSRYVLMQGVTVVKWYGLLMKLSEGFLKIHFIIRLDISWILYMHSNRLRSVEIHSYCISSYNWQLFLFKPMRCYFLYSNIKAILLGTTNKHIISDEVIKRWFDRIHHSLPLSTSYKHLFKN